MNPDPHAPGIDAPVKEDSSKEEVEKVENNDSFDDDTQVHSIEEHLVVHFSKRALPKSKTANMG